MVVLLIHGTFWLCATDQSPEQHGGDFNGSRNGHLVNQPVSHKESNGQLEMCCGRNGICSHEVLRDGGPDTDSHMVRKVIL